MESICQYCHRSYIPKRSDALYCSQACKQAAYVLRKAESLGAGFKMSAENVSNNKKKTDSLKMTAIGQNYPSLEEIMTDPQKMTDNADRINNYPSQIINKAIEKNEKPVNVTDNLKETIKSNDQREYKQYKSLFLDEINHLREKRDYEEVLGRLLYKENTSVSWVSERYKCLLECLLTFSEMKTIECNDLREICNAFTILIYSTHFDSLSQTYPYTNEILKLRDKLRDICYNMDENNSPFAFTLQRSTKQKFILSRWELSNYFPKSSFNELDFNSRKP